MARKALNYPTSMKAMVIKECTQNPEFEEKTFVVPPKEQLMTSGALDEMLVKVVATSVNPVDYKQAQSNWWGAVPGTENMILGGDVSGIVVACGPRVSRFKPGDAVFYSNEIFDRAKAEIFKGNSYAEYHFVKENIVSHKPERLTFAEAASLPLAGGTAYDSLFVTGNFRPGQTILIHGGSGGVGSIAIQLAKAAGGRVLTTCSSDNIELCQDLGADVAFDYMDSNLHNHILSETDGEGVDFVLDCVGGEVCANFVNLCRRNATMVTTVGAEGNFDHALPKRLSIFVELFNRELRKIEGLRDFIARGHVQAAVRKEMRLAEIAEAHQIAQLPGHYGKIVIVVDSSLVHKRGLSTRSSKSASETTKEGSPAEAIRVHKRADESARGFFSFRI